MGKQTIGVRQQAINAFAKAYHECYGNTNDAAQRMAGRAGNLPGTARERIKSLQVAYQGVVNNCAIRGDNITVEPVQGAEISAPTSESSIQWIRHYNLNRSEFKPNPGVNITTASGWVGHRAWGRGLNAIHLALQVGFSNKRLVAPAFSASYDWPRFIYKAGLRAPRKMEHHSRRKSQRQWRLPSKGISTFFDAPLVLNSNNAVVYAVRSYYSTAYDIHRQLRQYAETGIPHQDTIAGPGRTIYHLTRSHSIRRVEPSDLPANATDCWEVVVDLPGDRVKDPLVRTTMWVAMVMGYLGASKLSPQSAANAAAKEWVNAMNGDAGAVERAASVATLCTLTPNPLYGRPIAEVAKEDGMEFVRKLAPIVVEVVSVIGGEGRYLRVEARWHRKQRKDGKPAPGWKRYADKRGFSRLKHGVVVTSNVPDLIPQVGKKYLVSRELWIRRVGAEAAAREPRPSKARLEKVVLCCLESGPVEEV